MERRRRVQESSLNPEREADPIRISGIFTDLHHHVVYGVDDGAQTFEEAQKMLRLAHQQGIRCIVCTSHARPGLEPFPMQRYWEHLQEERHWLREEGIGMELLEGCEILWDPSAVRKLDVGEIPTINQTRYVLVEFFPTDPVARLEEAARSLSMAGYSPIFAHVERFRALRRRGVLKRLRDSYGVLCQMNANTVIAAAGRGLFRDRWPQQVLEQDMIDLVATDAHNVAERRCRMQEAAQALSGLVGADQARHLCIDWPQDICEGRLV